MRHVVILASVLVAAPAAAGHSREAHDTSDTREVAPEPPRLAPEDAVIEIGDLVDGTRRRRIERVDARVHVGSSVVVVELAIGVRGARPARGDDTVHQGVIELEVPAGANPTALALSEGGTVHAGEVMLAERARAIYERALIPAARDPALLEWTRTDGDREVLTLSVAPLTTVGATATVTFEIPRATAGGRVVVRARPRRGRAPSVVGYDALGTDASAAVDPAGDPPPSTTFVGPSLSLFAAPPPPARLTRRVPWTCTVSVGQPVYRPTRSTTGLRDTIRLYLPRVRHCFQTAAQRDRTSSEGTITASWTITEAGAVEDVGVAGFGNDALDACIAGVVESMAFGTSGDGASRVNYPFTFALPDPVTSR